MGPWVRGTRPRARRPRGARARRRVSAVWVLVASGTSGPAGARAAAPSRQAARAASSRSPALGVLFRAASPGGAGRGEGGVRVRAHLGQQRRLLRPADRRRPPGAGAGRRLAELAALPPAPQGGAVDAEDRFIRPVSPRSHLLRKTL